MMAVMLLGLQDYHGYIEKENDGGSPRNRYDEAKDIILHGILKKNDAREKG
jgi:hypothetical protein